MVKSDIKTVNLAVGQNQIEGTCIINIEHTSSRINLSRKCYFIPNLNEEIILGIDELRL